MEALPPPHVIVQNTAACDDAERASEQLGRITQETTAPDSWLVKIAIRPNGAALAGVGEILDGQGGRVAIREFESAGGRTCVPLARSLGIWATLVLEDRARARAQAVKILPAAIGVSPAPPASGEDSSSVERMPSDSKWRSIRMGVGGTSVVNVGSDGGYPALAGATYFLVFEPIEPWVLRPSFTVGVPTEIGGTQRPFMLSAVVGLDMCGRLPRVRGDIVFEECAVAMLGVAGGSDGAGPPTLTMPIGVRQGMRFRVGTDTWLEFGLRALVNPVTAATQSLGPQEGQLSPKYGFTAPFVLGPEVGLSWSAR